MRCPITEILPGTRDVVVPGRGRRRCAMEAPPSHVSLFQVKDCRRAFLRKTFPTLFPLGKEGPATPMNASWMRKGMDRPPLDRGCCGESRVVAKHGDLGQIDLPATQGAVCHASRFCVSRLQHGSQSRNRRASGRRVINAVDHHINGLSRLLLETCH